jgi:hypothetical protein
VYLSGRWHGRPLVVPFGSSNSELREDARS